MKKWLQSLPKWAQFLLFYCIYNGVFVWGWLLMASIIGSNVRGMYLLFVLLVLMQKGGFFWISMVFGLVFCRTRRFRSGQIAFLTICLFLLGCALLYPWYPIAQGWESTKRLLFLSGQQTVGFLCGAVVLHLGRRLYEKWV